jgi:hypothetical protein
MATDNPISYNKRTFSELRDELITLIKSTYPDTFQDFTDSSVGSLLLDLNAGIGNNLSINTDRAFQETQLEFAQQNDSILNIAKNLGFNIPGKRSSVTVVDFTVQVPANGDRPNEQYLPILSSGAQVVGGGKVFETSSVIDWNNNFSNLGDPNKTELPLYDSNGVIQGYTITKREVVINGATSIFKKIIKDTESQPFYQLTLPDNNVIEIVSVIALAGTNFSGNPPESEFLNSDNIYYEVDYLSQQRVFVDDPNSGSNTSTTGNTSMKAGKWISVKKKFIKEFTSKGLCVLTFGGGNGDLDFFLDGFAKAGVTNQMFLNNYLLNTSLGEQLKKDFTLFVKYRTGGGTSSNIGANVLTALGNVDMKVNGPRADFNNVVSRSLKVNNPIAAIGGNDGLSINQIRNLIKYNFSSQERDVTINDYLFQVFKMPGKYGSPFRANAFKENNKIVISIVGLGSDGKLNNTSNSLLKENIGEYVSNYRMVNDYVEIRDGKIFNLAFDLDLFVSESVNQGELANNVINTVATYFDVNSEQMNEDIFLGDLQNSINNINGVINILGLKAYNKVGNGYSLNQIEQPYVNETTREIQLINNTVYSTEDSLFEIKFPDRDIKLLLRKKTDLFV